eukprot:3040693-Alexandrium_andersonii.AAC.1
MLLDFYEDEAIAQQVIAAKTKLGPGAGYQPNPDAPDCVEARLYACWNSSSTAKRKRNGSASSLQGRGAQ